MAKRIFKRRGKGLIKGNKYWTEQLKDAPTILKIPRTIVENSNSRVIKGIERVFVI